MSEIFGDIMQESIIQNQLMIDCSDYYPCTAVQRLRTTRTFLLPKTESEFAASPRLRLGIMQNCKNNLQNAK